MCGIAGFIDRTGTVGNAIFEMTRTLSSRGPDGEGYYQGGLASLGHRRLSILDLQYGGQPIYNEDNSKVLVYNGEVYNFAALRSELLTRGHSIISTGDSEVLIHAFEEYGVNMLQRISGMFAFAIWDIAAASLFIARDHIGVKPLYYYWDGEFFAFASELKALLKHPKVRRQVDLESISLYLECQYIPAPKTIYKNIFKLLPAHYIQLHDSEVEPVCYWTPDYSKKISGSVRDHVDSLNTELRRSVTSMMVSDVPLGAFVSGGLDSSLIAALMTECGGKSIQTFNLGFSNDNAHSEHLQASIVAKHIGSDHHSLMIDSKDVVELTAEWTSIFDEPFGDQAALPTLLLSRFARRDVTVVMTGEGADEVFAGYDNYKKREKEEVVVRRAAFAGSPLPWLVRRAPSIVRKDRILKALSKPYNERYVTIPNVFDEAILPGYLSDTFKSLVSVKASSFAATYFDQCNSKDYIDKIMYVDCRMWLPDDLLTKVDRSTMACSLEARVPFLDHRLFEFAASLPVSEKHTGEETKYVLKKVAEHYLPSSIIYRRKQGFHLPLRSWLNGDLNGLMLDCLSDDQLKKRNLFNASHINRLIKQHRSGAKDHAIKLWVLIALELWFRAYEPGFRLS